MTSAHLSNQVQKYAGVYQHEVMHCGPFRIYICGGLGPGAPTSLQHTAKHFTTFPGSNLHSAYTNLAVLPGPTVHRHGRRLSPVDLFPWRYRLGTPVFSVLIIKIPWKGGWYQLELQLLMVLSRYCMQLDPLNPLKGHTRSKYITVGSLVQAE